MSMHFIVYDLATNHHNDNLFCDIKLHRYGVTKKSIFLKKIIYNQGVFSLGVVINKQKKLSIIYKIFI